MNVIRKELSPGVFFNHVHANKFKTGLLSAQLITPLAAETASSGALLPSVLRRGTERCRDLRALSTALDLLYGAGLSGAVRKKGENQCLGFLMGFVDDAYALDGERLLEGSAELLGEVLLRPALEGGAFVKSYVDGEKDNLIDAIRGIIDDKRDYADMRLLQEMCRGERYGIMRYGTEEAVAALNREGLYEFWQRILSSARLELFYCGSESPERVEEAMLRGLKGLPHGERTAPADAEHRAAPDKPRYITETKDVTQGKLSMGFRASSEDAHAMLLANLLFGGYSNSKLFLNVREKLSLCYYASSSYHRSKGIVTVSSGVEFEDYSRAHDEILDQLYAVQAGDFEPWELEGARSVLINAVRTREDSGARIEENLLGQAATGQWETEEELIEGVRAVTAERITEAARSIKLDTVYFLKGEGALGHA